MFWIFKNNLITPKMGEMVQKKQNKNWGEEGGPKSTLFYVSYKSAH